MAEVKRRSSSRNRLAADASNAKIGFVGAGNIASAIVTGLCGPGNVKPTQIHVAAPNTHNSDILKAKFTGLKTSKRSIDVFGKFDCDVIFLCVPGSAIRQLYNLGTPERPAALTTNFIPNMKHKIFVLSLISGFKLAQIKQVLLNPEHPEKYQIELHRIAINQAVSYGMGVGVIDVEPDSQKMAAPLRILLSSIGKFEYLPEHLIDAACSLVGSGSAYSFYFMHGIVNGAVKLGMTRHMAEKFAARVTGCAAQTFLETEKETSQLQDEVNAPSGPAVYGLSVLNKTDVGSGFSNAIETAYNRTREVAAGTAK